MARGSWSESLNHLIDAKDCGLLSFERLGELKDDWDKLGRILSGYINYLRSQTSKPNTEGKINEDEINYDTGSAIETEFPDSDLDAFRRAIGD